MKTERMEGPPPPPLNPNSWFHFTVMFLFDLNRCRNYLEASLNPYLTMDLVAEELRGAIAELGLCN